MTNSLKRTFIVALILGLGLVVIDFFLTRSRLEERKAQLVLDLIQSDKMLSSELYRVVYSLEDDFNFFEQKIQNIIAEKKDLKKDDTFLSFLNTHPYYFKFRVTNSQNKEVLKIVQKQDKYTFEESASLFDLSQQSFFKDLLQSNFNEFYFSSMEANIINGKIEKPLRPTIRVSKKIKLGDEEGLLILNLNGERILQLFQSHVSNSSISREKMLIDHNGFYIASYPILDAAKYTLEKASIHPTHLKLLEVNRDQQGSLEINNDVLVFTKLPLPQSSEKWYLVSSIPEKVIMDSLYRERLTLIFWELLCFVIAISWFWRDEKKRHKEQVVQVLLRERSEFIQNVSHQLKTPLTIIQNYLSQKYFAHNIHEVQKEVTHLIKVVEDLLLLSQIDSLQKIPLKQENMLEILNDAIELVGKRAQEKNINIRLNVQESLIDSIHLLEKNVLPELLKSAFLNLLDNAIDFSPPQGAIQINVCFEKGQVLTTIQDQGPGVMPALVPFIFQRYSRDHNNGRKGSGLGLAITKKIIELHHGTIEYEHKETGACFKVFYKGLDYQALFL